MANTLKFGAGNWATKEGSTLAYNDENNNYKPLPFDFSRTSSATRVNKQGLIETVGADQPRIDYLNDSNGALLLEPSRTNSLLQSNQFNTTWITNTATIEGGKVGVGNSNDAWLLSRTGTNGRTYQTSTSSGTQTLSIYAKSNTNNWLFLVIGGSETAYYDLENGVVGTTSSSNIAKIEPIGNNGWYRCSITFTHTNPQVRIQPALDNNNVTGSGSIYIQNSQLEQGSYATSYIPTQGSAVTRLADNTKIVNSPILQATNQFTLFFDAKDFVNYGASYNGIMITLGAGESPYDAGTGIHIYNKIWYYFNGSSSVTLGNCYNAITDSKFAISYDGNKYTRYANGIKLGTNTVSASMSNWDTITNGSLSYSGVDRVFDIADLKLYDTALSDSELAALTQV